MMSRRRRQAENPTSGIKIFSKEEWERINDYLVASERLRERNIDYHVEKRKYSTSLMKKYGKSVQDAQLNMNMDRVSTLRSEDISKTRLKLEKNKEQIINRAKKILFHNKDYMRRLLTALGLSSTLHERNKQIEFNRKLKTRALSRERKIRLELKKEAECYEEDCKRTKMMLKEKMKNFKSDLESQMFEKEEERSRYEMGKEWERNYMLQVNEKLKLQDQRNKLKEKEKKDKLNKVFKYYMESDFRMRQELQNKEKELDIINDIYQTVQIKLDKMRKGKESSLRSVTRKYPGEARNPTIMVSKEDKSELNSLSLPKTITKRNLPDPVPLCTFNKNQEEIKAAERHEQKLSYFQRLKKEETDKLLKFKEAEDIRRKKKQIMANYREQCEEKNAEKRFEKLLDRSYTSDYTKENKIVDRCCNEVLLLVKRHNRPVYPITAAIKEIKGQFLIDQKRKPTYLKSHVPIGNT